MGRKKSNSKMEQILEDIRNSTPNFKLQLDRKTTITLKTREQLDKWMELYPNAQIIS